MCSNQDFSRLRDTFRPDHFNRPLQGLEVCVPRLRVQQKLQIEIVPSLIELTLIKSYARNLVYSFTELPQQIQLRERRVALHVGERNGECAIGPGIEESHPTLALQYPE